jgi:hypothetical protein
MSDELSFYQEFAKAVPVVIGGLLAVLGGICGTAVTHKLTLRREKSARVRDRIEAFVKALYAHESWLDGRRNTKIFSVLDHVETDPFYEARMIQSLHFASLGHPFIELQKAAVTINSFVDQAYILRLQHSPVWPPELTMQPYHDAYGVYLDARNVLMVACKKLIDEI